MNVFISTLRAGHLTMATICIYAPNGDTLVVGVPHSNVVEATKAARAYGMEVVTQAKARSLAAKPAAKPAAKTNGKRAVSRSPVKRK